MVRISLVMLRLSLVMLTLGFSLGLIFLITQEVLLFVANSVVQEFIARFFLHALDVNSTILMGNFLSILAMSVTLMGLFTWLF